LSPTILVPPHIAALRSYEPGLTAEWVQKTYALKHVVKLSSNENPLGTSPLALEYATRACADLSRYADGGMALRNELAERFDLEVKNVIAGAGSEGIMANVVRTFLCDEDEVLTTEAAFLGFQVLARSRGVGYHTVPYLDWRYDLPKLAEAITDRTKLVYLANPNNPTGTFFTRASFEQFHSRVPERVLIILDEAYFEFATGEPSYPDSMHYRFDNVVTLRTFSKAYGLAAARVGYGFAHESLISVLLKVKLPFEPSGIASAAALGALRDREFMLQTVTHNARERSFLRQSFTNLGFEIIPSAANFLTIILEDEIQASEIFERLLAKGVIVRPLRATGLSSCLRVSVGTHEENEFCLKAFEQVRAELEITPYATSQ
jgi:histidinol-phosphate aminotransferase